MGKLDKFDTIIKVPSKTPPTGPDQRNAFALILASSSDVTFPDAAKNTTAIESEIAKAKAVVAKQPKEARRLSRLARWFPEHATSIVEWLVNNGRTSLAAKIPALTPLLGQPIPSTPTAKNPAGRPLDDELPYDLARFNAFTKEGGFASIREAAIALCGEDRAQQMQNKMNIFGNAFELSRKPRILRGAGHHKETSMSRDPNDDRSDSMNPNNDAYWDSLDNHADQLNPNNDEYRGPDGDDD